MTTLKIAMWSGPRNISTAMMRAFENRPDTEVWDEPMYGHYLVKTAIDHPGAKEVIEDQGTDWQAIAERCQADAPDGSNIFYQKHMTMHLLPEMHRDWLSGLTNCFLIRQPKQVVASYASVRHDLTLDDVGFVQQAELVDYIKQRTNRQPMIIDSQDFLQNPEQMLRKMCRQLGIGFLPQMLHWPAGKRETDGVWAKYWYGNVWKSTGFAASIKKPIELSRHMSNIVNQAEPYYQVLYEQRIKPD